LKEWHVTDIATHRSRPAESAHAIGFDTRAKSFTAGLAFGQSVTVRPVATDRYGSSVADVMLPDGRNLNHELVRAGYAWWYLQMAPRDTALERFEREAKVTLRGFWSQPAPNPPWEERRSKHDVVPAAETTVIANRRSLVYHRPECPNAARILPRNRITCNSPGRAEAAGYGPGKD
jgi:hypothetical protein